MRTACILLSFVLGVLGCGGEFFACGRSDSSGWTWVSGPNALAQWQFYDLAWEGNFLGIELLLPTRGWQTPPPPSLVVTLQFSTFGASLTRRIHLQRVAETSGIVQYFGQVTLARRDLNLGSYLCVRLFMVPVGVEFGVRETSLRVGGEHSFYAAKQGDVGGAGGPLVSPSVITSKTGLLPADLAAKAFRECERMEEAPYLSPGRYMGELGWPGPGCNVDSRDWLRVNLNAGHVLELQVDTPKILYLRLLDPSGQEVGRVKGSGRIGLVYQPTVRGVYFVCISVTENTPLFAYTLNLSIRR